MLHADIQQHAQLAFWKSDSATLQVMTSTAEQALLNEPQPIQTSPSLDIQSATPPDNSPGQTRAI